MSRIPDALGVSPAALGGVLVLAWLVALAWTGLRYRRGAYARSQAWLLTGVALFWIAFGTFQIAATTEGSVATGLDATAGALGLGGVVATALWLRTRGDESRRATDAR